MSDWGGSSTSPLVSANDANSPGTGANWGGNKVSKLPPGAPSTGDYEPRMRAAIANFMSKTPAPGIWDILTRRGNEAAYAKHAGRPYWNTLFHGEDPGQFAQDRAKIYSDLGLNDPIGQAALDIDTNPASILGLPVRGRSLMARGTEAAEKAVVPAAVKAGDKIASTGAAGKAATDALAKAHDFAGVHSAAKRELARLHGQGWLDKYAEYRARLMQMNGKPDPALEQQAVKEAAAAQAKAGGPHGVGPGFFKGDNPKFKPEDQRIFDLMRGSEHAGEGFTENPIVKGLGVPADVLTAGMFVQPAGHMANIGFEGLLSDPVAVAKALGRGTVDNARKLLAAEKGPKAYADEVARSNAATEARHAAAAKGGAISSHAAERDNIVSKGLDRAAQAASKVPLAGKAIALVPKALSGLYRASGDILWKFDDEVKAQRFQHLIDGGMSPARAGLRVGGELVDYENKSPAARALRPIAPFSTWRTKSPLATFRNAIENPGRATALGSLLPASLGGTQTIAGQAFTSSLPGAELAELTSGPEGQKKYASSSVGPIPRVGGDVANAIFTRSPVTRRDETEARRARTRFTYGIEPGTFLLNESPVVGPILGMTKGGMFSKGQQPTTLQDLLSLIRLRATGP